MKNGAPVETNRKPAERVGNSEAPGPPKFELNIDFDEILGLAILDSVSRVKRRKFKSRGTSRRTK